MKNMKIYRVSYHAYCAEKFRVDRPKGPGCYAFVHFLRPMKLWIDGSFESVPEDSFILYCPEACQRYYPRTEDMLENWMHFYCDDLQEKAEALGLPLNRPFVIRGAEAADAVFSLLSTAYSSGKNQAAELAVQALFCCLAAGLHAAEGCGEKVQKLFDFRRILQNSLQKSWNLASMAASVSYSPSYFAKLYRETFGISPKQDLFRMRIERAKYLLLSTSGTVEQIAIQLDYHSSTSFIKKFHDFTGLSPLQYRKQHQRI